jgi:hypothetical protein
MKFMQASVGAAPRRLVAASVCALALSCAVAGAGTATAATQSAAGTPRQPASASLEQCITSVAQQERSATFIGEMTAVPGTVRMSMRIELLERAGHEANYHSVVSPGLGAWQRSSPGIKTLKSVDKVTDLAAASYRAAIHFRWLNARGHAIKTLELRSPRCYEPEVPPPASEGTPGTGPTA